MRVFHGECLSVLRTLPEDSIDSIVTDPPYGLAEIRTADLVEVITAWTSGDREHIPTRLRAGFMGRAWDRFVPPPAVWDECLRVLRPGGHLLAFAGSRTVDLMGLSVRLAGFDIRDGLSWIHGEGFPKSLDVGKAIDTAAGAVREPSGAATSLTCEYVRRGETRPGHGDAGRSQSGETRHALPTAPATAAGAKWEGWGTALKPAQEPIVLARKPLAGTVAANVSTHGTGALNVAGCRVGTAERVNPAAANKAGGAALQMSVMGMPTDAAGRWPANVVLSHAESCTDAACTRGCPVTEVDVQGGYSVTKRAVFNRTPKEAGVFGAYAGTPGVIAGHDDAGGASRFFPVFRYQSKASDRERVRVDGVAHPTVKPLSLMQWLVRLVTPPGGTVLDPFAGSGTTGEACVMEWMESVLIEREDTYIPIIAERMARVWCDVEWIDAT